MRSCIRLRRTNWPSSTFPMESRLLIEAGRASGGIKLLDDPPIQAVVDVDQSIVVARADLDLDQAVPRIVGVE